MKNHYFSTQNHEKSSFFIEKSWIFMTGPLEWGVRILGFARISRTGYAIFFCSGGVREKKNSRTRYAKKIFRVPLKLGWSIFNFFPKYTSNWPASRRARPSTNYMLPSMIFEDFERILHPWRQQSNNGNDKNQRVLMHFRRSVDNVCL